MVVQVLERKPGNDDEREPSFESKYMIQTGNYVKFGTQVDTIFRNVRASKFIRRQLKSTSTKAASSNKNDAFYEIINKKPDTITLDEEQNDSEKLLHEEDKLSMWIDSKDLYCSCPKIRLRRKYLVMSKSSNLLKYLNRDVEETSLEEEEEDGDDNEEDIQFSYDDRATNSSSMNSTSSSQTQKINVKKRDSMVMKQPKSQAVPRVAGLLVDRRSDTSVIEWRPNYARRLRRFIRYYQSGKCS
jgi:hypothetical protein